jgi:hypothetical protein
VELLAKHPLAAAALGDDWSIIFQGQQLAASFEALYPGCTYQARETRGRGWTAGPTGRQLSQCARLKN